MVSLYDVPGFGERYESALGELLDGREAAWLDVPLEIGAFLIRPLTLRALVDLNAAGNALMRGGKLTFGDVAAFLWRLSPDYRPLRAGWRRKRFFRRIARLWRKTGLEQEVEDARAYLAGVRQESVITSKHGGSGNGQAVASFAAYRVDALASQYGWGRDEILDLPLAQINQLLLVARLRNDPDAVALAPLAELRNEALRVLNAQNEELRVKNVEGPRMDTNELAAKGHKGTQKEGKEGREEGLAAKGRKGTQKEGEEGKRVDYDHDHDNDYGEKEVTDG